MVGIVIYGKYLWDIMVVTYCRVSLSSKNLMIFIFISPSITDGHFVSILFSVFSYPWIKCETLPFWCLYIPPITYLIP